MHCKLNPIEQEQRMIEGLVAGNIWGDPEKRIGKNNTIYVVAKVRAQVSQPELVIVNVIAFDNTACKALLERRDGDAVSLTGSLLPKVWIDKQGVSRVALDMIATRVMALESTPAVDN
jgi:single-stranded DNA-binding protein